MRMRPFTHGGAPVTALPAMEGASVMPPRRNLASMLFRQRVMRGRGYRMGTSQVSGKKQGGPSGKLKSCPMPMPGYAGGTSNVLTARQRQALPRSDFALPGRGKGKKGAGPGSYPIPDRSHAANALSRSSGKPVAAQVRRKVCAKYPDMPSCG